MPSDFAIHSDLLVYWTGAKDIEKQSNTNDEDQLTRAYIERLTNILRFGLWMTDQSPPQIGQDSTLEETPCTCFTELKLSQSQDHATAYGRLGVAFKRPFLFVRGGRPVIYYSATGGSWMEKDTFLHACAKDLQDKRLMHFFKPMNSSADRLNYDLYSESEWRIVFKEDLLNTGKIVDPRKSTSSASYFQSLPQDQQKKLRYLIPVDGWLALIIYPSIKVKNMAQQSNSPVRQLLQNIKGNMSDHPNQVEGGNYPVEIDLDLCKNF